MDEWTYSHSFQKEVSRLPHAEPGFSPMSVDSFDSDRDLQVFSLSLAFRFLPHPLLISE